MGVRVRDPATGETVEVSSQEAQDRLLAGSMSLGDLQDDSVRVIREGNRTGTVSRQELATAIAEGWSLADDEQVAQAKLRREESDFASQALGVVESGLAGASLGASTWAETNLLGVDPERMKARREGLGDLATVAEVGGGIAATIGTGGLGGVAGGAARAGAAAARGSALARGASAAGRALAAPSRLAARAGIAAERGLGGGLAGGLARGAIEGAAAGAGSVINESVLDGRDITAERLVAGGVAGAAFGGAIGGGVPLGAKLLSGGAKASNKAIRSVIGRLDGGDELAPAALGKEVAEGARPGFYETAFEKAAPLSSAPRESAAYVGRELDRNASRVHRRLKMQKAFEEKAAGVVRDDFTGFIDAAKAARIEAEGASRLRNAARMMSKEADGFAPGFAENLRSKLHARVSSMSDANALHSNMAYDVPTLRTAEAAMRSTFEALGEAGVRKSAATAHDALYRLKKDLRVLVKKTGGFNPDKAPPWRTPAQAASNDELRAMYKEVNEALKREDVWGSDVANMHRGLDDKYRIVANAEDAFSKGAKGSPIATLFRGDEINMRQAMNLIRKPGHLGGSDDVARLNAAMEARLDYLREVKKHADLSPDALKKIDEAENQYKRLRAKMDEMAEDAEFFYHAENLRNAQGDRSVSMTAASTLGPAIGGMAGLGLGGIPGAIVGTIAGGVTRPYTALSHIAAIKDMADGFAGKTTNAITPMVNAIRGIGRGVGKGAKRASKAAPAAAARVGVSRRERAESLKRARENAVYLATQPGALADAMSKTTELLTEVAPGVARQMGQITQRAALFLASKAPPAYKPPMSNRPPIVDPLAAAQYARFVEAVTDPVGALSRLNRGTFTPDHAEAIKIVYPEIYADVQRQVTDAIMETLADGGTVSLPVRSRMAALFDAPVEPAMSPERLPVIQASIASAADEAEAQMAGTAPAQPQMARVAGADEMDPERLMTPAQRVASGVART